MKLAYRPCYNTVSNQLVRLGCHLAKYFRTSSRRFLEFKLQVSSLFELLTVVTMRTEPVQIRKLIGSDADQSAFINSRPDLG